MENPKLALIPSGYKSGKVYSILPVDGVGDFDFNRSSESSRVNKNSLIETVGNNVPKLDWLNSDCPSLLLEPQRTNRLGYSEQFNTSSWGKSNSTIDPDSTISPNGELSSDKLIANTVNTSHYMQATVSGLSTSSAATFSVFIKKAEISQVQLLCAQNSSPYTNWARIQFDLDTLSFFGISEGTFGYEDYGNGWVRLFTTGTPTTSNALIRVSLMKNSTGIFAGNNNDGIYLFGAQVEQGGYPTSYIKTTGSSVTRLNDICINGGNADLFDISEGTFFVDVTPFKVGANHRITLSNNTSNEEIIFYFLASDTGVSVVSEHNGSIQFSHNENIIFDTRNKLAFTFKNDEFKLYINGSLKHTDTNGDIATGLNSLHFAGNNGGFNYFQGEVHDTRVYDRVLTEAEAIKLTK